MWEFISRHHLSPWHWFELSCLLPHCISLVLAVQQRLHLCVPVCVCVCVCVWSGGEFT